MQSKMCNGMSELQTSSFYTSHPLCHTVVSSVKAEWECWVRVELHLKAHPLFLKGSF